MKRSFGISMMMFGVCASVACGPEMEGDEAGENGGTEAVQSVEQSATAPRTTTAMVLASSCGWEKEVTCAGLVRHCIPACTLDKNSWACKSCIEHTFTFGIDCWSCLYNRPGGGGGTVPAPQYYSCRSFPSGGPDDTTHPRYRSATSRVQETCEPPVYNFRTRRWTKWCCLFRVR